MSLYFYLLFNFFGNILAQQIDYRTFCGSPPVPATAYITDYIENDRFEGKVIFYKCENYLNFNHQLECKQGRWTGKLIKCGITFDNEVKSVTIFNENGFKKINVSLTSNTFPFPTNFARDRSERVTSRNVLNNSLNSFIWNIELEHKQDMSLVRVDLSIAESDYLDDEPILITTMKTSSNRICKNVHKKSTSGWYSRDGTPSVRWDFWFECDIVNSSNNDFEVNQLMFETRTVQPIDVDLAGLFVARPPDGDCGEPEVPLFSNLSKVRSSFSVNCDSRSKILSGHNSTLKCDKNGSWRGFYPTCRPISVCRELKVFNETTIRVEYDRTMYANSSNLIIDGSTAKVTCRQNMSEFPVIVEKRCFEGSWSGHEHFCGSNNFYGNSEFVLVNVVTITLIAIVIFCGGAIIGLVVYTRKISASQPNEENTWTGTGRESDKDQDFYDSIRYSTANFRNLSSPNNESDEYDQINFYEKYTTIVEDEGEYDDVICCKK